MIETFSENSGLDANSNATAALDVINKELHQHQIHEPQKSYLAKAIDTISGGDTKTAEALQKYSETIRKSGNQDLNADQIATVNHLIEDDRKAIKWNNEINHYAGTFLKVAPLFLKGGAAWVGTGIAYAADQARPSDTIGTQLTDGLLGATKGVALKGAIGVLGGQDWNFAIKGAAMGVSNRFIDQTLTRQTYLDPKTGKL